MSRYLTALFALALLVLGSCDSGDYDFGRGLAAFEKGDYGAALDQWRPLAAKGDAKAQYRLALMLAKGQGVERNIGESLKLLHGAAAKGNGAAQY